MAKRRHRDGSGEMPDRPAINPDNSAGVIRMGLVANPRDLARKVVLGLAVGLLESVVETLMDPALFDAGEAEVFDYAATGLFIAIDRAWRRTPGAKSVIAGGMK